MELTVSHRVAYVIAGREHATRVDTVSACMETMRLHAHLGMVSVLQYMGTMTRETADRMHPAY